MDSSGDKSCDVTFELECVILHILNIENGDKTKEVFRVESLDVFVRCHRDRFTYQITVILH
jgi:hypothetical protein